MNLGQLIAALDDERHGEGALEALGDIVLLTEVRNMSALWGESVGAYIAASAGRFAAAAGDETWLSLVGAMERAEEPGKLAMQRILRWALDDDTKRLSGGADEAHSGCTCGHANGCGG